MSKRAAFIKAACKEHVDDFLQLVQLHKDRTDPFDLEEVMEEMARDQREAVWGELASLLRDVLLELPPERWDEVTDAESAKRVVAAVTLVATVSLKVLQNGDTYNGLLNITRQLHEVLVSSHPRTEDNVLPHIQTLCEAWWKKDLLNKDKFGRTALVIALNKILYSKKMNTELQRAWSLHKVVSNVNYASEDGQQLSAQLLQCFRATSFIRNDDGKRFMVFLFSWHVDFVPLIHEAIKNQLQFYNTVATEDVAEIYFRAWKKASGKFLEKIESECIQDLMKCAILLQRSSPLCRKVRQIIFYFHKKNVCPSVGKMLSALYKPILWKYLNVPNFEVRTNATVLFADAFPIVDPDTEIEEALQKQLDKLKVLLFDKHDVVRCNAIQGVCKVLARCWELLPSVVIVDFLKKLEELAGDSSSDNVRCAVFAYLCVVLDNVLSHPALEKLMPKWKNSLHDASVKVRVAFVDMLLKVKAVRAAKFWDVCSLDHLVARLARDTPHVSKRLAELLVDSFFPAKGSDRDRCNRCVTLIQMSPAAARKFYLYASVHTAPNNIVKFMLAIRQVLNLSIRRDDAVDADLHDSDEENRAGEKPFALDKDVVATLLEVVVILWKNISRSLEQNEETRTHVHAQFGQVMSKYLSQFTDERCQVALMQMASFMPFSTVATFSFSVLARLRKMEPEAPPSVYGQLLDCMCSWGKTASVLELLIEWLSQALPESRGLCSSPPHRLNAKRKVTIQVTEEAKPDLALAYLDHLLLHPSTRNKVLALSQGPLKHLYTLLGNCKSVLSTHLNASSEGAAGAELALKAFTYHGRLSVHLQHHLSEGREYLQSLEYTAAWLGERVLPVLAKAHQGHGHGQGEANSSRALAAEIIQAFLTMCGDVVLCLDDDAFNAHVLHLCSLLVRPTDAASYLCIPAMLQVLKELMASYSAVERKAPGDQRDAATKCLSVVANIFQKIIELLAGRLKKEPEEGKRLCQSAVSGLQDFLRVAQASKISAVFDTLFAIVVVETSYALQKMTQPEEVTTPEKVDDLPILSSTILSVLLHLSPVTGAFWAEMFSSLYSDTYLSLTELAAVVHLLAVLRHAMRPNECLKKIAMVVQQRIHAQANAKHDVQGAIYQSSVTSLNDILTQWEV
ncbi:condensin-2 complex subunit G2 isoform X2 [Syngnathus typhle]|uniref:condensin-2 complex subunit G2 isoform X2 n=1 Tax=Syngnathus typhle TaxID=161592 RepID=UPI002A6A58EA|nr:condensin-2 complex subunit G2 isoform X2 [Syngnathus typhle]